MLNKQVGQMSYHMLHIQQHLDILQTIFHLYYRHIYVLSSIY